MEIEILFNYYPHFSPSGKYISNNFFYNNGHGIEDDNGSYDDTNDTYNISAHIFVKTNKADRVIKRHNIVNNIFDTGYFKGWDDSMSNTDTLSTISCIHIVGQNQESIKNFIIDLFKDRNILGKFLSSVVFLLSIPGMLFMILLAIVDVFIKLFIKIWKLGNR